jgi:small GTP-binding protein
MDIKGYSLAILGDSGVGKTCFATRFCGENFNEENKERLKPTRGAEYFQRIFYYNKESIKIDIYDISGDKKYEKVSKYLYRYVRSIILMYNICNLETFEHLQYFFDNIGSISVENPSIYIVGNFSDKAKFQRQVNETHLKKYKNYEVSKFYEISALNSQDRDFKIILDDITRGIVDSGKWYETKIYKDLGDLNSVENENKNEKLKKDLKNFNKDKKPYYLRCKVCEKLFIIKFKTIFNEINFICDNCKINETIKIAEINKYIEDISNRINCQMCLKKTDSKYKLIYCTTCKKYFCPSCEKSHDKKFKLKKEDNDSFHNKCPYYLIFYQLIFLIKYLLMKYKNINGYRMLRRFPKKYWTL